MKRVEVPLWAKDLAYRRGGRLVFTKLSLHLDAGEGLVVVGPNGAGKSSLLRMLAGLARPSAGAIHWGALDIAKDPLAHRARTAYLGHLDAVKSCATVRDHLELAIWLAGRDRRRLSTVAGRIGLEKLLEQPGRRLSAGQRRRLALGRMLLSEASLWLLDEPANALDLSGQTLLTELLQEHLAEGGRFVLATHQPIAVKSQSLLLPGGGATAVKTERAIPAYD